MITRGFVTNTIVNRGLGVTISAVIVREILRAASCLRIAINLASKIWNQ